MSSTSPKKPIGAKGSAVFDEQPKRNLLAYYFCCFCILPKQTRKLKRKAEKARLETEESIGTYEDEDDDDDSDDETEANTAATKIQARVRGFQTRGLMSEYWKEALEEANAHWLKIVRAKELAWLIEERKLVARKQFVLQYVEDVVNTSLSFFEQTSQATTDIQRLWRGHRSRSQKLPPVEPAPAPKKVKSKPRFPPPKVIPRPRFSQATLRRVWSRKEFRPANNKWIHTTDFGHLEYDMWEYTDHPPAGNDQGMRLNKVRAVARNDREVQALTGDKHAWVGLPIGIETYEERRLMLKKAEPENVTQLKAKSPYNAPVVNWDKFDAVSKEEKQKRKAQIARNKERNAGTSTRSSSASGSGTESSGPGSGTSDEDSAEENENNKKNSSGKVTKHKRMNEKNLVKKLEKFGYDPATMDPFEARGLARLGTFSYDINTGRRIKHKGNNRWVGANDASFEVQYDLPPQAAAALEEANSDSDGGEKANLVAELGEGSLTRVRPTVFYHRSGAVTVSNPSLLNQKSRFLREHRSMFLDNYTHHNLSEYSGLLSSTYFDLTLHAQGLLRSHDAFTEGSVNADDDTTDFNYMQSPAVPLAKANVGFSQSFMTESVAGLEKSKSESRLYPSANVLMGSSGDADLATDSVISMTSAGVPSNVRYTKDGTPIRGARKPYVRKGGPVQAPLMPYAALTETYKGRPGSQFESNLGTSGVSKKNPLSAFNVDSQLDSANASSKSNGNNNWKASAWGKLKQGVEDFNQASAADPSLQGKLFHAALQSQSSNNVGGYEDYDVGLSVGNDDNTNDDSVDSDEEMWRSRSLYKPSKNAVTKLGVWPRAPKQNYKLRYTWIPQPLLHNAVNNLYHEKTVWEYRKDAVESNPHDFKKELLHGKARYQRKVEKSTMLSVVSDSLSSSRMDSPSRRANPSKSVSLAHFGPDGAGLLSPMDSSVASSKYYKHFVRNDTQPQTVGSPTVSVGMGMGQGSERGGRGGSVMITALEEDDASSLDSGSLQQDEGGSFSPASSTQQLLKNSQLSFSLRSKNNKSATYDAISVGSRSPGNRSLSPSGRTSPASFSPTKRAYSPVPSAMPGNNNNAADFDRNNRAASPSGFSTSDMPSPGGSAASPWDSIAGAPTSSFYSAKITSMSASKLIPHQQSEDAEFNHNLSSGAYLAEMPADFASEKHPQALFVEKRSTSPNDLRANHYLPKQVRVSIKEPSEEDAHYFVPFAPVSTSPKAGGTSAKFKFKPTATRTVVPPPADESPQGKARNKPTSRASFVASASAGGSQQLMQSGATTGSVKRPPPPSGPPPDYVASGSLKMNSSNKNIVSGKASPKGDLHKKLSEKDTIHKYHFL